MKITSGTETQSPSKTLGSLPRILVVDREKGLRDIVVPCLFRDGFDCREAEDGRDAIDLLATRVRFDLVLSCLLMPIVDGYTLLLHVKKHYPKIPFAFVTAIQDAELRETVMRDGADDYLLKPFSCEALLTMIRKLLRR